MFHGMHLKHLKGLQENSEFITIYWQKLKKMDLKRLPMNHEISWMNIQMFEDSKLGFLSVFKEFKSLLSSNISWISRRINYV